MGRPKNPERRNKIIAEYENQMRNYGHVNYSKITKAVGLHSNHGRYAQKVVKAWLLLQSSKGQLRECLGPDCGATFLSTGKHHRLCDKCRFEGEYMAPFSVSPSVHFAGAGRW